MDGPEHRGAYAGLHDHEHDEQSEVDLQNYRQHIHRAGESSSEGHEDSEILDSQGGVGGTLPRYRSRSTLNHNANGNGSVDMSSSMPAIKAFDFETGARLDSSQSSSSNYHNQEMSNASSTTTKVDDSWSSFKPRKVDWSLPQETGASKNDEKAELERPSFNRSMSDFDKDDQGASEAVFALLER
jgi:hypothetical protein